MRRTIPIFYSALLLTGVNLLLRLVGTSFQVYLSGAIGAAGIGLLQLTMSVGSLAMVAGTAGVRTTAMYLTAEELGKRKPQNVSWVLSGCFLYSIVCSGTIAAAVHCLAPVIAQHWIGDLRTVDSLRLFAAFLPTTCLCGCMTGYFTAANRIGTLAAVEVAEQLLSMTCTVLMLQLWACGDTARACLAVILGSSLGGCMTLLCLVFLRLRENSAAGPRIAVSRRLLSIAAPLALADDLRSGISTVEHLMVPKRLSLNTAVENPLAAFGLISGMVFPILMLPACILYGLAELLIPELARCAAAGSRQRISYLVRRSLRVALLYGVLFSGLMFLLSDTLCMTLYKNAEAGKNLKFYSVLIPMLYCDAITDAMTKGLGQQKICVRYNILTSSLDVLFLYFLLPKYGLEGYFLSFFVTHLLNFALSLRLLLRITGLKLPVHIPLFCAAAALAAVWAAGHLSHPVISAAAFVPLLGSTLFLLRILSKEDLVWFRGLIRKTSLTGR